MSRDDKDPYVLLGVPRQATASDIKRAYRRAAREAHPDNRRGDPSAAERFQAVTDAYETLRDAGRRAAYDRAHRVVGPGTRPMSSAVPPPVQPGARRRATFAFSFELDVRPRGRRPEPPSATPAGPDELFELAAAVSRRIRARWLLRRR